MNTVNTTQAIDEFIENWKNEARKYYMDLNAEKNEIQHHSEVEITFESLMTLRGKIGLRGLIIRNRDEAMKIMEDLEAVKPWVMENIVYGLRQALYEDWKQDKTISDIAVLSTMYNMKYFEEALTKDAEGKKKKLITSVEKKIGKIIDARGLNIGVDGSLNGFIIGENGKASVNTIYAGGYNIQKLHYRTLINICK